MTTTTQSEDRLKKDLTRIYKSHAGEEECTSITQVPGTTTFKILVLVPGIVVLPVVLRYAI
jgi:hypothetical protein